ncbi:ATP-binding protein [Rubrivivax sp. RP6-9]|uniref:ATP-binding protein n=1 Tax=Rubrivivax sp. RP6-9 TaxID=3415750 RepID=UPI003CC5B505
MSGPDRTARARAEEPSAPAPVTVSIGAGVVTIGSPHDVWRATQKTSILLAMVALEGTVDRRRVAQWLWPGSSEAQARNNLRVLVHRLHQRQGAELLVGGEQLSFDAVRVRVVLHDPQALLAVLQTAGAAGCELLADAGADDEAGDDLQAWLAGARQRWRRLQLKGLRAAMAQAEVDALHGQAVALARACVQLEPLSEQWHRQLMDTLARSGDRAAALAAYEDCKALLQQQLGVLPDVLTRTVQLRILQGQEPRAPALSAAQPSDAHALTPLGGAARYPLIEREAVLADVHAALAQGRHVALQGEPGVGKTRLLRHLAVADAEGTEQVAVRLGLRDEPYAAVAQLLQEVQPRRAPRLGMPEQVELARLAPLAFPDVQASAAALSAPRLHAALRHWVQRLRQAGVQRLVLDDLHHADAASQAAIGALLTHDDAATPGPLLLLAHRSGDIDATLGEVLVAAQASHRVRCIALQRLTLAGVQQLLEAMQTAPHAAVPEQLAERLLQRTGGNPLFVIELAQQVLESGAAPEADTADLQALLRARLAGCSPAAQQLAAVAAVAAAHFSLELAMEVMQQAALALMPAWQELQRRGLFVDHGLAHDLVRDAVLAATPGAIGRVLHRQVARHLEAHGLQGAVVLRHWLAADEPDHALPHAAHQLYAASAIGRQTAPLEADLLALLERTSDAVLLDNLWLTAEIDGSVESNAPSVETWQRLAALVDRVERLAAGARHVHAWLAFERARTGSHLHHRRAQAYAELGEVVARMPGRGVARAQAEVFLALLSRSLNNRFGEHLGCAREAVAELPRQAAHARLLGLVETMHSMVMPPLELMRRERRAERHARRQGDLASVHACRRRIAQALHAAERTGSAARIFGAVLWQSQAQGSTPQELVDPVNEGLVALNAGWFNVASACFSQTSDVPMGKLLLALTAHRLGQPARARALLRDVDIAQVSQSAALACFHALLDAELDAADGRSPLPALERALHGMREAGARDVALQLVGWEIRRHAGPLALRRQEGLALLAAMRTAGPAVRLLPTVLLNVGATLIEAGDAQGPALVREAALQCRRRRFALPLYIPEALLRCARLLHATDPAEAAALRHVARRWVLAALPHVPEAARQGFLHGVAAHRELLGDAPATDRLLAEAWGRQVPR